MAPVLSSGEIPWEAFTALRQIGDDPEEQDLLFPPQSSGSGALGLNLKEFQGIFLAQGFTQDVHPRVWQLGSC